MINPVFKVGMPSEFSPEDKNSFLKLLKSQGKIINPSIDKINRCKLLGICVLGDEVISIAAIKVKSSSDFNAEKADLQDLSKEFKYELGYCFTKTNHTGKGYSSRLVNTLIQKISAENLLATTELREDNSMQRILINNGFKQYGNSWKSKIHGGDLGLFLRFV
jgi:hypothetical protein